MTRSGGIEVIAMGCTVFTVVFVVVKVLGAVVLWWKWRRC